MAAFYISVPKDGEAKLDRGNTIFLFVARDIEVLRNLVD